LIEAKKMILAATTPILFVLLLGLPAIAPASATSSCYGSNWGLNVFAPTPGEVVTTPYLAIHLQSVNYQLDSRVAGTPDVSGVGHYHEYIDNNLMPGTNYGLIDMTPTTNPTHDQISMVGVSVGPHILTLVPACNDHMVDWAAAVNIPFTYSGPYIPEPTYTGVAGASPTISIASPAPGTVLTGASFYMSVNVQNFLLCGTCYGKYLQPNVGHWHVFVTPVGGMPMMSGMMTMANTDGQQVYLNGLAPGWYTFWAVLVQNNHMPFMDPTTGMLVPGTYAMEMLYVSPLS
jgi:hypothetical protein